MAKVTGPLFSLSASGQIAKTLVFMPWKGLNNVRKYVIPTNPNTALQDAQRDHLGDAVDLVHVAMSDADPLNELDTVAYSAWASTIKTAMTWFNMAVKNFIDQRRLNLHSVIFTDGLMTPGAASLELTGSWNKDPDSANDITAGNGYYGTSKTALIHSVAAVIVAGAYTITIPGLVTGQKYYVQFRATVHADFVGAMSGIYNGTPI